MAITTAAVQLPMWLVIARASDMNLSMPRMSAMPATGTSGTTASVAARVMKPEPVTPAGAFAGDHRHHQDVQLLAEGQFDAQRLRDEERRQRHVDVGAVQVEGIAGGHDQTHDGTGQPDPLQFFHQRNQRRFRGAGGQDQEQLALDVPQQTAGC